MQGPGDFATGANHVYWQIANLCTHRMHDAPQTGNLGSDSVPRWNTTLTVRAPQLGELPGPDGHNDRA